VESSIPAQVPATEKAANQPNYKPFLIAIIALLTAILVFNAYQIYSTSQRIAKYEKQAQSISDLAKLENENITKLMTNYQADAYDNPQVDRIAAQQLIATEYNLTALQLIGIQNAQIIQLLSVLP
jgi:hypothetical protein